ncbi:MAG: hypothetical protein ACYDC2_11310, partial [Solirubrobacteraceae bacterium]
MFNEAHQSEVEKVLLYISEARERAERARLALERVCPTVCVGMSKKEPHVNENAGPHRSATGPEAS